VHALTPVTTVNREESQRSPARFVETGVTRMLEALCARGARKDRVEIRAAGGARPIGTDECFAIGRRNVVALKKVLWQHGVLIRTHDVGGAVTRVLSLQVASYVARIGVNATYMSAFGIPVTIRNIFLIIAANSISSTFAVTPGGVGTQQALASVALRDVAPTSTVTAYSLAQQLISMAWNITFGLIMMISTFGWSTTKGMIQESRKEAKQKRSLSDLEKEDEPDAAGADAAAGEPS